MLMKDDEDEDILIENLGVHPSRPAQRVISGTIECLLDSITQVNSQIVQSVLPLPLHCASTSANATCACVCQHKC